MSNTIEAHGGTLINLLVDSEKAKTLKAESAAWPSITLTHRQLCDLELLSNGGYSPLTGFMQEKDYQSVIEDMRLANGTPWPMPIVLDVNQETAEAAEKAGFLALRDLEGFMVAVLTVESIWRPDKTREAEKVYLTTNQQHPGVEYLFQKTQNFYIGGAIQLLETPGHFEFANLWRSPLELRSFFTKLGWRQVVCFQTAQPMHRLQREITVAAAKKIGANALVLPSTGFTLPNDPFFYARIHCYQAIMRHFPHGLAQLSLLPLAARLAGPHEALWHAIVQQNYGCTHMIVGPNYASPWLDQDEQRYYPPASAQELVQAFANELAITTVSIPQLAYNQFTGQYQTAAEIESSIDFHHDEVRNHLVRDIPIPNWVSYPEVLKELSKVYRPRSRQGITLFFTGLSGSGKSTLAKILYAKLVEEGNRPVTLLDGDVVRTNLSSELGFSKEHRDLNIRRIGYVASEITKNGGVAICAPIAPYSATRQAVRELIETHGAFIEIHVATPLEVCESRDRKGLYAKARKGIIKEFTGISDPYEEPSTPEWRVDTTDLTPVEAVQEIYLYILREGYIQDNG